MARIRSWMLIFPETVIRIFRFGKSSELIMSRSAISAAGIIGNMLNEIDKERTTKVNVPRNCLWVSKHSFYWPTPRFEEPSAAYPSTIIFMLYFTKYTQINWRRLLDYNTTYTGPPKSPAWNSYLFDGFIEKKRRNAKHILKFFRIFCVFWTSVLQPPWTRWYLPLKV